MFIFGRVDSKNEPKKFLRTKTTLSQKSVTCDAPYCEKVPFSYPFFLGGGGGHVCAQYPICMSAPVFFFHLKCPRKFERRTQDISLKKNPLNDTFTLTYL